MSPEAAMNDNPIDLSGKVAVVEFNGQLFIVYGPTVTLVAAPVAAHRFDAAGDAWDPAALSDTLGDFFAKRDPNIGFSATELMGS